MGMSPVAPTEAIDEAAVQEALQRKFLEEFSQGMIATMLDISFDLPKEKWFLQQKVLDVKTAPEPEALFFENIGLASEERRTVRALRPASGRT